MAGGASYAVAEDVVDGGNAKAGNGKEIIIHESPQGRTDTRLRLHTVVRRVVCLKEEAQLVEPH